MANLTWQNVPVARVKQLASTSTRAGLIWAFIGVLLFSFSLPLTKIAVEGFDPFLTATGRAAIAGMVALAILALRRIPFPDRNQFRPLFFTMLGAVFGWPIFLALALERTTSAHAAVIAAFMPLTTAIIAVLRFKEVVSQKFWVASSLGTAALVIFALTRGGAEGADFLADILIVLAVLSSSWCYVEGAAITRVMPGWQVISWVVVMALPVTIPSSVVIFAATSHTYSPSSREVVALIVLGLSSMYFAFFFWYRGLALAGTALGSQVQQLQALLTLLWSALLLGEVVTPVTVIAACVVVVCVAWALRTRASTNDSQVFIAPEE